MEDNRIRLKVMGLSIGQIRSGAYALILEQVDGPVKIPVVIGEAEARAIAARMENQAPRRPMTHDLFATFAHAFGIAMQEVFIHKFEDGIFYSDITFTDGTTRVVCDSRTSDAIAIAMRTGAPIYTTEEILHTCGFVMDERQIVRKSDKSDQSDRSDMSDLPLDKLLKLRREAEEREDYEEAARLTEIINQKK